MYVSCVHQVLSPFHNFLREWSLNLPLSSFLCPTKNRRVPVPRLLLQRRERRGDLGHALGAILSMKLDFCSIGSDTMVGIARVVVLDKNKVYMPLHPPHCPGSCRVGG
jgi:hypothetical protein